jgi:tetratricopeptide (TPR) repeat protein
VRKVIAAVAVIAGLLAFQVAADPLPLNQQPMYGGQEKTEAMGKADEEFLAKITSMGFTRESGSKKSVELGWQYFFKGDVTTAMMRFNQAWFLNAENGDAYHGFAVVTAQRGGPMQEVEKYFKMALTKPGVTPTAYVDYARLLNMQGRHDDAIAQGQNAISVAPKVRNARAQISYAYYSKKDAGQACRWGRQAKENGDAIDPPNYVETICEYAQKAGR